VIFHVAPTALVKAAAKVPANWKPGMPGELIVTAERLYDFQGELRLKFTLPGNTKGITLNEAVLPAGSSEVRVPVTIAADAPAGPLTGIGLVITGMYDGKISVAHELKFNAVVEKLPPVKK
jgi:hypothetical protein